MTWCKRILANLVAVTALLLAGPSQADGIFTLRIGYNHYPHFGGYYNYWPDQFWYGYWPYFYSPVYIGNYYPFYYPFYPSYYYSYFYYRPYIPLYYSHWCYPWYSCTYYGHSRHDRHGHNRHDQRKHHDHDYKRPYQHHYSSLDPYTGHDRYERLRSSYKPDDDKYRRNRHHSANLYDNDNRSPRTSFHDRTRDRQKDFTSGNNFRTKEPRDDRNIKFTRSGKDRESPVVSSGSRPGTVRFIGNSRTTAYTQYSAPERRKNHVSTYRPAPVKERYSRPSSPRPSFAGNYNEKRTTVTGRSKRETRLATTENRPPRALSRGNRAEHAPVQSGAGRQHSARNDRNHSGNNGKDGRGDRQQRNRRN